MSTYNVGTVTVQVGSAIVRGSGTSFLANISSGNLFKLTSEAVFYDVASALSATRITLSTRYTNTSYYVNATAESIGTTNVSTTGYSGTLDHTPVIQSLVVINASDIRFVDDGAGVLTGTNTEGTHIGTIDYDTGAFTFDFAATYNASYNMLASYTYGSTLSGMQYQVVTDFTPNYSLPEISSNDTNFANLTTHALRMIDTQLKVLEDRIASYH